MGLSNEAFRYIRTAAAVTASQQQTILHLLEFNGQIISFFSDWIQEHDKRIQELLGEEKATRLENEYEVTDIDPYDLEGVFTVGFGG